MAAQRAKRPTNMGRKLCLSSLFFRMRQAPKSLSSFPSSSPSSSSSTFPCCILPKTLSFRAADDIFKTVNSIYFDSLDSFLTFSDGELQSSSAASISGDFAGDFSGDYCEMRSDRLFFEPGEASASIMVKAKGSGEFVLEHGVAMTVDSEDPGRDFRVSMEEMVVANGVRDWEKLAELLVWFLRANGKENHGFIFGAFLELILGFSASSSNSSFSSSSSSSSSSVSRSSEIEELQEENRFC